MITKHFNFKALRHVAKRRFSGGHDHHHVYDWRDDPKAN
jgi:hypothetical protein